MWAIDGGLWPVHCVLEARVTAGDGDGDGRQSGSARWLLGLFAVGVPGYWPLRMQVYRHRGAGRGMDVGAPGGGIVIRDRGCDEVVVDRWYARQTGSGVHNPIIHTPQNS